MGRSKQTILVPAPRHYSESSGSLSLRSGLCIHGPAVDADVLRRLTALLRHGVGLARSEIAIAPARPQRVTRPIVQMTLSPHASNSEQAFTVNVHRDGVDISADGDAGLHYACQVIIQLARGRDRSLPFCKVDDHPDFAVRGVMVDCSRDKMPKFSAMCDLIGVLSELRINQLQLYTEHSFAYRDHKQVWTTASPWTHEEIIKLDELCRENFIDLVPNQNCFGHMERWLAHRRYRPLAETNKPWVDPWGRTREQPTTLNPLHSGSIKLVDGLIRELGECFSSKLFNVGCDETFELGQGESADACKSRGVGRVFMDYLLKVHKIVRSQGRTMMFWADVAQDHPEVIKSVPKDAIALEWGYEADHAFDKRCARLKAAGVRFYVCPGTSSWCSYSGRSDNAIANLTNAVTAGLKHGAEGYLITDWGDGGHHQYLPASYAPLTFGASISWGLKANKNQDAGAAASFVFMHDPIGDAGRLWFDIGNVDQKLGVKIHNGTILFRCMQTPLADLIAPPADGKDVLEGVTRPALASLIRDLDRFENAANKLKMTSSESRIARREFRQTIDLLRHACRRADAVLQRREGTDSLDLWKDIAQDIKQISLRHRILWLIRNRSGGLIDSRQRLERNLTEYQDMGMVIRRSLRQSAPVVSSRNVDMEPISLRSSGSAGRTSTKAPSGGNSRSKPAKHK